MHRAISTTPPAVLLRFANGASGYLSTIMVTGEYFRIQVLGTRGWVELRGPGEVIISDWTATAKRSTSRHGYRTTTLEAFAAAALGGTPFAVSPQQAVSGVAALEAIDRSARIGKKVKVSDEPQ